MQFRHFITRAVAHPVLQSLGLYTLAFGIGILAGHGVPELLPASFLFVALLPLAKNRRDRWLVPLGYFGAYLITMFPGAAVFYGHDFDPFGITILWVAFSALFAAPWALLINSTTIRLLWAVPFILLIEAIPPIGLFAVGSPLQSAGILLPHTGWFGLAAVLLLSGFAATHPRITLPVLAALTLLSTYLIHPPASPRGWLAVNTRLGGQGLDRPEMMRDYLTAQFIQRTALTDGATVTIFPESLVRWNTATEDFWKPTLDRLKAEHRTLLVGATVLIPGPPGRYRNTVIVRGATDEVFDQRIPIPITMWHPLDGSGVPLNYMGQGTILIAGHRAAILICYEQLLVWPFVRSFQEHPDVLVGVANDYWASKTYFPKIQRADMIAWGQLFNLPVLTAVNE